MTKLYLFDFAGVILFPVDKEYTGELNGLYDQLTSEQHGPISFFAYFELNSTILEVLQINKHKHQNQFALFTREDMQEDPELKLSHQLDVFDHIFTPKLLGGDSFSKSNSESYLAIANKLGIHTADIWFVDAAPENVVAAASAGCEAYQYTSNDDILEHLSTKFNTYVETHLSIADNA